MSLASLMLLLLIAGTLPFMVRQLYPPLPPGESPVKPGCVVVLGGGAITGPEGRRLTHISLRRLGLALQVAEQRRLPLLLSGGGPQGASEAALMDAALGEASISRWQESASRNTLENARFSAELLRQRGIDGVVLVTDRAHMPRAMLCFRRAGLEVEPVVLDRLPAPAWMPSAGALALLPEIWYEWLALIWYHLKGG
ncbi:MAG: YdcF family protein [Gammaproteobacteria bacterium HGW-Gammaproteobacteria-14]|nr:MAG: YdcF family protein [Gammaproteobacteria bacterium HGW-Gammaproteobacteria-14]